MPRLVLLTALALAPLLAACDSGFGGSPFDNRAPETELSVRSVDLREDLGDRRLVSTIELAWSGVDADGVVAAYDVRAYVVDAGLPLPGAEEGWTRTTRRDSTILLPIPEGRRTADVAVEVRAVDNDGGVDETPARTVFPIINSDPTFRLTAAEAPPDTTWPVLSFAFTADDPDGTANLAGVEVALNDTLSGWTRLPADLTFVTLVAADPTATGTVDARVLAGRTAQATALTLPGLRMDADNRVFFRAVDAAGAASRATTFPDEDGVLFVRRTTSPVLLVNDLRSSTTNVDTRPLDVMRAALAQSGTASYDTWDLSQTPLVASAPQVSEALPVTADPTLRLTFALWSRIAWVSNAVTNSAVGNNLPLAAPVLGAFFDRGGRMLVQTPITAPLSGDEGQTNPAIDLLPMNSLVSFLPTPSEPRSVRTLRANAGTVVSPASPMPGTSTPLPPLAATALVTTALPYTVGPDDVVLYTMPFTAFYTNNTSGPWGGSTVVASASSDGRVALFALPLFSGAGALFGPATPGGPGVADALAAILDGLDFSSAARSARPVAFRR